MFCGSSGHLLTTILVSTLAQIIAPLLTVNFADDQINAPGFPALESSSQHSPKGAQ